MPRSLILDVDTGTDDAIAIMLAALHPALDLMGCTTVWGNLDVGLTTDNTLRVLDHVGRPDVPVFRGLGKPIAPVLVPESAESIANRKRVHPEHLPVPPTTRPRQDGTAVEWLLEVLRATTQPVTLVPVGPLTNIAAVIVVDPSTVEAVEEIVIMGGGHAVANVTASSEANIWHDPTAADIVFQAGFERLVLVPLDATHQAMISMANCQRLQEIGTPAATTAAEIIMTRINGEARARPSAEIKPTAVHDALCIAYLIDPDVVELQPAEVTVETVGHRTYGRTVVDLRPGRGRPNAHVALSADPERFFGLMQSTFSTAGSPSNAT